MGGGGGTELESKYRGGDKSKDQQPKSNQTPNTRTGEEEENKEEKEEEEGGEKR